jgi:phage terminase large subunit-like protein
MSAPEWTTSCENWQERIVARQSLIPPPLFPAEAQKALEIFRELRIVDAPNSPTMGEACRQWVFDFVAAIFGAYDHETGRRLIQHFLLLISKKNSKSTIAAGIMVVALTRNWRESGEYIILAPVKEAADNSFFPCRDMVKTHPHLSQIIRVREDKRVLVHLETNATLKVVAADSETVSGKKTIGLLVDELWLFGKRASADGMIREAVGGLASRPEGFAIYLSTQSDAPPSGLFAQKLQEFRDIRDGKVSDPHSLPVLFEFPPAMLENGEYRDPKNWFISNPNLGTSVDEKFLIDEHAKADRAGLSSLALFEAKHLNVQAGIALRSDGWAGAEHWAKGVDASITLKTLIERCEIVDVGGDGGGLDDLLGICLLGRERGTKHWLAWGHAFISPQGLERRKANRVHYDQFITDGDLTVVAALPADITGFVDIVKLVKDAKILDKVGIDAFCIGGLIEELATIGITQENGKLVGIRQGVGLMSAFNTVARKLIDGSFKHADQRLMSWCAGNAVVVPTPTGQRLGRDESGYGKVDPLHALFDAATLLSANPELDIATQLHAAIKARGGFA